MSSRRARRGAAILSLCLGLLPATACGEFGGDAVRREASQAQKGQARNGQARDGAGAGAPAAAAAPVVMILGDSYTVGERGSQPETTYAPAAARLLGWQVVAAGKAGTGFVATGTRRRSTTQGGARTAGQTFMGLFESQLGWRPAPDLLIVSGGHNDRKYPAVQTGQAARELLTRAKQRWPGTPIVLIGPIWGNDTPLPTTLAIRDVLRGVAQELKIPFIDPIAERWITGNRATGTGNAPGYIRPDGVHPTIEGHRYLATRLVADIKRLGLEHPVRKG
ncbi:SGNH/GDSL hydrolase family protein [Actinomadura rudentiformis]|uniref:SGNH/GDSL hydrolase family protein n=1 Tax=Actinomadura rudentiformis TaxID=359158 RepID=A0A6H9YS29_9ACTN|nr:SGNH/GDSL hydrolase family protein [Actinomadura rudentiformis]KAB2342333.1 SGNH/GDSL hydrolase family protein [Actinomadura rudentiformis]